MRQFDELAPLDQPSKHWQRRSGKYKGASPGARMREWINEKRCTSTIFGSGRERPDLFAGFMESFDAACPGFVAEIIRRKQLLGKERVQGGGFGPRETFFCSPLLKSARRGFIGYGLDRKFVEHFQMARIGRVDGVEIPGGGYDGRVGFAGAGPTFEEDE